MSAPDIAALDGRLVADSAHENAVGVGRLERLPKWLNLIPMIGQWLWLSLWHGSWTLPAAANPSITAGGLVGEGKSEYFGIMGSTARAHTADFAMLENTRTEAALQDAEKAMRELGLEYPVILKPDIGWCGFGVRIVRSREELQAYLEAYPRGENIILQRFISYEGEAGIYYVRHPNELRGRITGILLRFFPRVVGDGRSTVAELMARNQRTRRLGQDGRSDSWCDTTMIPALGEIVRVCVTGSTRVGGLYRDGTSLVTPALQDALHDITADMKDLHVARFDVRYESIGELRKGTAFKIIEVNGAGSEAVHAWDPSYTLAQAYRIVFEKQRTIFSIGAAMRKKGHQPPGGLEMARLYLRQARLIRRYPPSN